MQDVLMLHDLMLESHGKPFKYKIRKGYNKTTKRSCVQKTSRVGSLPTKGQSLIFRENYPAQVVSAALIPRRLLSNVYEMFN